MLWNLVLFASLSLPGLISQDLGAECGGGFTAFKNSCYGYVDHPRSWSDAQSTCSALGGFLAEVYSDDENEFLKKMINDHGGHTIWLGADDLLQEGKWFWARSGSPVDEYDDWASGQPDNGGDENCMELNRDSFGGHWNDDQCGHKQRFICQKYMETNIIG